MKSFNFDGHKLMYHPGRVTEFLSNGDCFPLYLEISPVGSCNHRCLFCAYDFIGYPNRKLESKRLLALLDELAAAGLKSALFAGEGEPLLHPDLETCIVHGQQKGIDMGLFTNGQLLTGERAARLLPALTFIRFSFNGGTSDAYSRVHQVKAAAFDTVVAAIANAAALKKRDGLNTAIGAQFVLLPENIDSLPEAARVLREAGVDYLAVKPFVQQSQQQGYQMAEPFHPAKLESALSAAEALSSDSFKVLTRRNSFNDYGVRHYKRCLGTSFISVVNSAGDVASCLPYWDRSEYVFGNIYDAPFSEIWHGARRREIKQRVEQQLEACSCPPNCRPNAINEYLYELRYPTVEHVNFI